MTYPSRSFIFAMLACLLLSGCQGNEGQAPGGEKATPGGSQTMAPPPVSGEGDQEVLNAQAQQMRKVEVTMSGPVIKMLPDDTKGLPHERWLMRLTNGTTVMVAHDTKLAPRLPLQNGDEVRIHGEYIWNEKGGVIHWTHHAPQGRHEPGWIDFNGKRYE